MVRFSTDGVGHPSNLAELAVQQQNIRAICRCGHVGVIDGIALWWLFARRGRNLSFSMIGRHLVCTACRRRGPKVEATREPGSMAGLECPGERVWKQLVKRYRT